VNFEEKLWPVTHYSNESCVGWNYTNEQWNDLTGNVLDLIDREIGDNMNREIEDEIKHGCKRRNSLV
jgi:hypothetical protein